MSEQEKKAFVERIGVRFEQAGFPPMSGRIFGCLVLADPPYLTFDEIREYLDASKSTISANLNMLMQGDCLIDYMTLPGDRKRYFRINPSKWLGKIKDFPKDMENGRVIMKEIIEFRDKHGMEPFPEIEKIQSFHDFMSERLPALMEEWEKHYASKQSGNR